MANPIDPGFSDELKSGMQYKPDFKDGLISADAATNVPDLLRRALLGEFGAPRGPVCTCREEQKQRALCPVCDKEQYDKLHKLFTEEKSR